MSYSLSCVGLPDMAPKCEQLADIHFLYEQKDVFLWIPTGFKSGGKLRSMVLVISPLGKFLQFVQLALDGFCFCLATVANEWQQSVAFGDWHRKKLTKVARKVNLQLHRAEPGCGVLWGYLCRANVACAKPRGHFAENHTKAWHHPNSEYQAFFSSHAINAKGPGYEATWSPSRHTRGDLPVTSTLRTWTHLRMWSIGNN